MGTITTRIINSHDLEVEWNKHPDFVPKRGELIILDAEVDAEGEHLSRPSNRSFNYSYARIKIGDGHSSVSALPVISKTDELLYITPKEFMDRNYISDAEAINDCFRYVKKLNLDSSTRKYKPVIKLDRDYDIDDTLILDSGFSYGAYGLTLDGCGHKLRMTKNKPLLQVRGSFNTVCNLTLTFDSSMQNNTENKCSYTNSLLVLHCDARFTTYLCHGTVIDNVHCIAPSIESNTYVRDNVGFEIFCFGEEGQKTYAYMLNFKKCSVTHLGTAIKVTQNEYTSEVNGNMFDVSSWSCHKYLDGVTNGCTFEGLVQACYLTNIDHNGVDHGAPINPYLLNNIGMHNKFDCVFYDTAWNKDSLTQMQKILNCDSLKPNVFTTMINAFSVDGDMTQSVFYLYNTGSKPHVQFPFNPLFNDARTGVNTIASFPHHNSFAVEGVEITTTYKGVSNWGVWSDRYDNFTYGDDGALPESLAPLFSDNPWGRASGILACDPDAEIIFNIKTPEKVRLGNIFVIFEGYNDRPAKLFIKNLSTGTVYEGVTSMSGSRKYAIGGATSDSSEWEIKLILNCNGTKQASEKLAQIAGCLFGEGGYI